VRDELPGQGLGAVGPKIPEALLEQVEKYWGRILSWGPWCYNTLSTMHFRTYIPLEMRFSSFSPRVALAGGDRLPTVESCVTRICECDRSAAVETRGERLFTPATHP
jgi:hypothetical protein